MTEDVKRGIDRMGRHLGRTAYQVTHAPIIAVNNLKKNFRKKPKQKKESVEEKPVEYRWVRIKEDAPIYRGLVKSGQIKEGDPLEIRCPIIK